MGGGATTTLSAFGAVHKVIYLLKGGEMTSIDFTAQAHWLVGVNDTALNLNATHYAARIGYNNLADCPIWAVFRTLSYNVAAQGQLLKTFTTPTEDAAVMYMIHMGSMAR